MASVAERRPVEGAGMTIPGAERLIWYFMRVSGALLIVLVGGHLLNPTGNADTGEYLGDAIEGGERYELGPGSVAHVPAGLPHSFLILPGEHLTYVLVKFPAP